MTGDSAIPIAVATAQRFAARERRQLKDDFTLMVFPLHKLRVDAETHVEQLRPMGASDSFPLLIGGAKSVRAIRVDQ